MEEFLSQIKEMKMMILIIRINLLKIHPKKIYSKTIKSRKTKRKSKQNSNYFKKQPNKKY